MADNSSATPLQKFLRTTRPLFILVGVGILVFLVKKAGWSHFKEIVLDLSWVWIAAALACWILNLAFASLRFRSLAAPNLGFARVFEIVIVSYLLNYASMLQGMSIGAKVGMLKGERVPVAKSLAGAGAEIVYDLIFTSVVIVVFILYAGVGEKEFERMDAVPLAIVGFVGVAALIAIIVLRGRVSFFHGFVEGLKTAFSPGRFPPNMFFTATIWIMAGASFYFVLLATRADLSLPFATAAMCAGFAVGLISLVPGGLGVRDITWTYFCTLGGVPLEKAAAASIIMRVLYIISVAIMVGCWGFVKRRIERGGADGVDR